MGDNKSKVAKGFRSQLLLVLEILLFIHISEISSEATEHAESVIKLSDKFLQRDSRKSAIPCPDREYSGDKLECPKNCTKDSECSKDAGEKCICFGECGYSCINKQRAYCKHPGMLENGKVVYVGPTGLYELRYTKQKVPIKGHILFECDPGYSLIDGPPGKTCQNGTWEPLGFPECTSTENAEFDWLQSGGRKRRAIKPGGSSILRGGKGGPGGSGGYGPRRGKKKGTGLSDDDEYEPTPVICPNLDHDPYIQIGVIQSGSEPNETFSSGAIVKVSCKPGFGVNLPNETVRCDKGRWRPKIPQCSALPCKTPYIIHGTFYEGSKPLYFQEVKKHKTSVDFKCTKGYKLKGPSKFYCWFGEWDISGDQVMAPECIPVHCQLPHIEAGHYVNNHEGRVVLHGTEVDYTCGGSFRKLNPGPARCQLGEWRPSIPYCVHPSISSPDNHDMFDPNRKKQDKNKKDKILQPSEKRACGSPPKENGAYIYVGGLPVDWDTQFSFPDASEVLYRCKTLKAKAKNRWKITCEDGSWVGVHANLTCDGDAPLDKWMSLPILSMVNGSCMYRKTDKHVVTFFKDQIIIEDSREFPHETVVTSRCVDIGKFRLEGAMKRKCLSSQWLGLSPKCVGLSQYQDYSLDQPPTILFRYVNGSIVQSTDGNLVIFPGTTLHMECLWIRKFGKPEWRNSNPKKTYPEGWAEDPTRDSSLEYRITIENAQADDSGTFSCKTPARQTHEIKVIVKAASCDPLPPDPDLEYSTNDTILGTKVTFTCRNKKTLIGTTEIFCSSTGTWSTALPRCEYIECLDISLFPPMAPLSYTSTTTTKNVTLKRNETSPPKITVFGTHVGAKVTFGCEQQGYRIEGVTEAVCQQSGQWSDAIPICKEVECPRPPEPDNGYLTNGPRFKAGDFANFECNQGFLGEGQPILACQDNGRWSKGNGFKCLLGCPYPGAIIGGLISENNKPVIKFNYLVGDTLEFDCKEGYELQGPRKLSCLKSGKWSTSIPSCIPNYGDHNFLIPRSQSVLNS